MQPGDEARHKDLLPNALGIAGDWVASLACSGPSTGVAFTLAALLALSGLASPLVVLVCGLGVLLVAIGYARLNRWRANAGAPYVWVGAAVSPVVGFATGILALMIGFLVNIGNITLAGSYVLGIVNPGASFPKIVIWLVSAAYMVLVVYIAIRGIRPSVRVQGAILGAEYAIIISFAIASVIYESAHHHQGAVTPAWSYFSLHSSASGFSGLAAAAVVGRGRHRAGDLRRRGGCGTSHLGKRVFPPAQAPGGRRRNRRCRRAGGRRRAQREPGGVTATMTQTRFFDFGLTFVRPVLLARDRSSALLIIDMQYHDASPDQGFNLAVEQIQPGAMKYFNERNEHVVIPTIRELLEYFREQSLPVIYLTLGSDYADYRDIPPRMREWIRDVEERSGVRNIFWTGNPAFAIRREIKPLPGETTICKRTFGAFNSSNLDQFLRDTGVRNLVITGISTNACVETTARDAADRGWGCVMVSRGMADYDAEAHEASLRAFHFNFGRVVDSAADVITAMEQGAPI